MDDIKNAIISVIVPVYNSEKHLNNCLESITGQTYKNIEIILVDDGSTDGSLDLLKEWEKKDERIKLFHKENGGAASARNIGLEHVTGEYISFVDSDDIITENMLEYMLETLEKYDADICQCGMEEIRENGSKMVLSGNEEFVATDKRFWELVSNGDMPSVCILTKLYKSALWEKIRFPEGHVFEDEAIILQMLKNKPRIVIVPMPFYNYLRMNSTVMRNLKSEDELYKSSVLFERMDYLFEQKYAKCVRKSFAYGIRLLCNCYKDKAFMKNASDSDDFYKLKAAWVSKAKEASKLADDPQFKFMMFLLRVNWPLYVFIQKIFSSIHDMLHKQ